MAGVRECLTDPDVELEKSPARLRLRQLRTPFRWLHAKMVHSKVARMREMLFAVVRIGYAGSYLT
jgi:hypothetical protein